MIHWYERVLAPIFIGGSVWLYGLGQRQGSGYKVFVRYAAIFAGELMILVFTLDLMPSWWKNNWPLFAIGLFGLTCWVGWKRHLS